MSKLWRMFCLLFFACALAACTAESWEEIEEDIGEAEGSLLAKNALVPNALVPNALVPNALVPNALSPSPLSMSHLSLDALAALQSSGQGGALSRKFIEYAVSCAFDDTQLFTLTWTDTLGLTHTEEYPGHLGLAPSWETGPLVDEDAQRMVSACLASRTNYYGVSVLISVRSHEEPLRSGTTPEEIAATPKVEGAFWGNLFTQSPYLNACYKTSNVSYARQATRECAAGHLNPDLSISPCGMIAIVGSCSAWCSSFHANGQYYMSCAEHPGVPGSSYVNEVITVALP